MPHAVVSETLVPLLKSILSASAPLTSLLAVKGIDGTPAIYSEGEPAVQSAPMPYLTIGGAVQVPEHTMGPAERYGWNCTVQIKGISRGKTPSGATIPGGADVAVAAIMSAVATELYDGRDLTLAGYTEAWVGDFNVIPTLIEQVSGVTTWSMPAIVRFMVHD